jgi:hypothetical protein
MIISARLVGAAVIGLRFRFQLPSGIFHWTQEGSLRDPLGSDIDPERDREPIPVTTYSDSVPADPLSRSLLLE